MTLTRNELLNRLVETTECTKRQGETILNTLFDTMTESLVQGDGIELRGFGSFRIRERDARTGRNPRTGERVDVQPKKVVFFRPGKGLKDQINSK